MRSSLFKSFLFIIYGSIIWGGNTYAANTVTPGTTGASIYGDGNRLIYSPNGQISGYNNNVYDAHGNFSDSTDAVKVIGSENILGTGKNNSVLGNSNTIKGAVNSNSTHLIGNDNSITNAAQANTIGNENTIHGNNGTAIGDHNQVTGNSIALGGGVANNGGIAIGNGSTATNANEVNFGDRQLTGIQAGIANTDAANVGQLNNTFNETLTEANHYTDETLSSAKNIANQYTDQKVYELLNDATIDFAKSNTYALNRFSQLEKKLKRNEKLINAGISSAIASASVPAKLHKKISLGMGIGSYRNEIAYALGVKYGLSKNIAIGSSIAFNSQSNASFAINMAYGF